MAVRKDSVEIDITFITDENREYAKLNQNNTKLLRDFRKIKKEGGDVAGVIQRIAKEGQKVENLDLSKVAPAELVSRARTLGQVLRQIPESAPGYAKLNEEYKRINTRLAEIRKNSRGVIQESNRMASTLQKAFAVFGGISLAGIAQGILNIGRNIIRTSSNFQKFEAVLSNALGSRSEAQRSLKELQDFAATTPFQLEELTASYIKLVNRGIKPAQEDLRLLGDIAASQGKEFDQLVEAVLDAGTGEFERLKEFGIRAKKDGDTVQLAFKGITKEVANTEEAITQAILDFGKLEGVIGTTASIAQTRGGLISNFFDNINRLFSNLGNGIIGRVFDSLLRGLNSLTGGLVKLTDKNESATASVAALQAQFNIEIETLKRGNLSQENRAKLIDQINTKYGSYLPNLIEETDTVQDLALAQRQANQAFLERIAFIAAEEKLVDVYRQQLAAKEQELELEKELSEAIANNLGDQSDINDFGSFTNTGNVLQTQDAIDANKELQESLRGEFEQTLQAANELGVNIEAALFGTGGRGSGGGGGNPTENGLDTRLKGIEAFFRRQQLLLDRALLEQEVSESEHGKRTLQLQVEQYDQQLEAFELYNEAQSIEAEEARNKLLQVQQQLNRGGFSVAPIASLPTDNVERRGINEGLDDVAEFEEAQLMRVRSSFEAALIAENEYVIAKLELRRNTLEQEIELLRMGTDAEVQEAARKAEQLKEVDQQLADERRRIAEDEAAARRAIDQAAIGFFKDSIDFGIELLAQDEEARKKNISVIRAFQRGKVVASGIAEVQKIWERAAEFGPLQTVLATIQTLAATARTGSALARLNSTKFTAARGLTLGTFGGKLHSQGGTKGVFSDGTTVEVERDENFVILNRRASGMLGALSDLNVATGGRSLLTPSSGYRYNTGGLVPTNTTPTSSNAPLGVAGGVDFTPLLQEFRLMRESFQNFPRVLRADISYFDLETASEDVTAVRNNSSV